MADFGSYVFVAIYCHLLSYCYSPLGVFVTHDNTVAVHVGACCLGSMQV